METRFGKFDHPLGRKAESEGWTLLPCIGTLEGDRFSPSHRLMDHIDVATAPAVLKSALAGGWDAAWVRARLARAFAYEPVVSEVEKSLLCECFVASREDDAYLFECLDYYGKTSVVFSPNGPERAIQDAIASAFWAVLLREPDDLADFQARVFHPGAGVWLDYACKHGELSLEEREDDG
jgi:hypothetical protein